MKTLRTFPGQRVALGHQGENLALTVIFSIGAWADAYGPGTVHLAHMRNGDPEAYPVAVTQVGTEVSWEVSDADTAVDGYGKYELRYIVGETVVKSSVGETYVRKALQYGAEPPEPVQSWLDHVAEKEHELLEAADDAKEYSENASRSADSAAASAGSAASSAKDAADSAAEAKKAAEVSGGSGIDVTAKPGQMIRVKFVDENGKPTVWEPVPWGYTEGGMVEIMPEITMTEGNAEEVLAAIPPLGLVVGDIYTVKVNGVEYACVAGAYEDEDVPGISLIIPDLNMFIAELPPEMVEETGLNVVIEADANVVPLPITLSIYQKSEIHHPIPGKLLPEGVPYVEHGATVGQTVRISAVDENGVPTAWESVDFPSSGGNVDQSVSVFNGRTAAFYGDSITEVNYHYTKGYHAWLKELLGFASYNNRGVSGYTIQNVYEKVNATSEDTDIIFIMCGVNDLFPLGKFGDTELGTTYGAIDKLCSTLKQKYPTKIIVVITPAFQNKYSNEYGSTCYEVSKAFREVCEKYAIPVYDNNRLSGIYYTNLSTFTTDGCHWNDVAHEMVGKNLARFMLSTFGYVYGETADTPEEPEKTLVSISATYSGGDIAVGTDVNDLTGIVVTAHYSDGSSKTVTSYILSGTIAEGGNTITVNYGGKTTTFTVNGIPDDNDEPDTEHTYQSFDITATAFDFGTNVTSLGFVIENPGVAVGSTVSAEYCYDSNSGFRPDSATTQGPNGLSEINDAVDARIADSKGMSPNVSNGKVTLSKTISYNFTSKYLCFFFSLLWDNTNLPKTARVSNCKIVVDGVVCPIVGVRSYKKYVTAVEVTE